MRDVKINIELKKNLRTIIKFGNATMIFYHIMYNTFTK